MQGDVAGIQDWIVRYSSTLMHTFGFAYEFPQYILVRARLAQFRNKLINEDDLFDCIVLLDRLLLAAEKTDRLRSVVTISILKALIYQDLQQPEKAISALRTALVISEQSGLVQLFLDEGIPMEQLLQQALERKICTGYTIRLLVSFREALPSTANTEHTYTHRVNEMLVEPLSPRELEILNRIAKRASNKEIAEHCSIEVSTVKSHVSNILGKLGSRSRRQAVQYARDIGLIHS
jgi:LuxR family maltose regulon positive regulatory protein